MVVSSFSETKVFEQCAGFRKENLRVQIGTNRRLKLSGEEEISEKKRRRINKEFSIPSHSSTNGIKAKLEGGLLYIRIPKNITEVKPPTQQPYENQKYPRETREAPTPTPEEAKKGEDDRKVDEDRVKATSSKAKEMHEGVNQVEKKVYQKLPTTLYGLVGDIMKQNKLPNLVVAIFLFLAMGIYVKNVIMSAFGGSSNQDH